MNIPIWRTTCWAKVGFQDFTGILRQKRNKEVVSLVIDKARCHGLKDSCKCAQYFSLANPRACAAPTYLGHKGVPNLCLLQLDYASLSFTWELSITCPKLLMPIINTSTTTINLTNDTQPTVATNISQQFILRQYPYLPLSHSTLQKNATHEPKNAQEMEMTRAQCQSFIT